MDEKEDVDYEEAADAAVDKRKFLLNRIFIRSQSLRTKKKRRRRRRRRRGRRRQRKLTLRLRTEPS